jgi:hypothetical protein
VSVKSLASLAAVIATASLFTPAALVAVDPQHSMSGMPTPPGLVRLVREATRPFLDVHAAVDAQYGQFLGCVSGPQEGAMGIHFVNLGLVGDGELDVNHPEALIYEPKNGELRLVGAEYIVTVDDWRKNHLDPAAPVLEGQVLQLVDSPNRFGLPPFYELPVWAWQNNPHGPFVDWNTLVSCEGR